MQTPHPMTIAKYAAMGMFTLVAVVGVSTTDCRSQQFPEKPVTLIVGTAPGSADDIVSRILADRLKNSLGQPVVVQSMAGGGGAIAMGHVVRSSPDGYTLLLIGSDQFRNEHAANLEPITLATRTPMLLVVGARSGIDSVKELIGRGNSVQIGTGSASARLSLLKFQTVTGVRFQQVPFQGTEQALTAVAGGQIAGAFCPIPCGTNLIQQGQIKPLAISSSQRSGLVRDVPTFGEQGVPDMVDERWNAAFAPRGTPKEIMDKLNAAFVASLELDEVRARLSEIGAVPFPTRRGGFAQGLNLAGGSPVCGKDSCPKECNDKCDSDNCCKTAYPRPE